jgi:hypothetical protein
MQDFWQFVDPAGVGIVGLVVLGEWAFRTLNMRHRSRGFP